MIDNPSAAISPATIVDLAMDFLFVTPFSFIALITIIPNTKA